MIDVQKRLAEDLRKIFNMKVKFDVISNNIEQDVIIVETEQDKTKYFKENAHVIISGTLGFRAQNVNDPHGYLKDRMAQADNKDLRPFRFGNIVTNQKALFIGQAFITQSISFVYTKDVEYDKPNKLIEFKDLIFNILGLVK